MGTLSSEGTNADKRHVRGGCGQPIWDRALFNPPGHLEFIWPEQLAWS